MNEPRSANWNFYVVANEIRCGADEFDTLDEAIACATEYQEAGFPAKVYNRDTDQPVYETITNGIKYPGITVRLVGEDGNGFSILGRVKQALQRGGVSQEEVSLFLQDAMSGDYDHLLQVVMLWVTVE